MRVITLRLSRCLIISGLVFLLNEQFAIRFTRCVYLFRLFVIEKKKGKILKAMNKFRGQCNNYYSIPLIYMWVESFMYSPLWFISNKFKETSIFRFYKFHYFLIKAFILTETSTENLITYIFFLLFFDVATVEYLFMMRGLQKRNLVPGATWSHIFIQFPWRTISMSSGYLITHWQ